MRACVIFNPAAKGRKAERFRWQLGTIGQSCVLLQTTSPGEARRLAGEAVRDGFDAVIAAGGDGTVNEVINGMGDHPEGFQRACLGVLPLGTVNVFARELGVPSAVERAWAVIQAGREIIIDLATVQFGVHGTPQRRRLAQLAGAGLDARAIELVSWPLKKKIGPLAYIWAGLKALGGPRPQIKFSTATEQASGELILIGNGRLYGGRYCLHPQADLRDGRLDVRVFPRAGWATLVRCGLSLLARGTVPESVARRFQAERFTLTSDSPAAFELDGEWGGHLPATFTVERARLRVRVP